MVMGRCGVVVTVVVSPQLLLGNSGPAPCALICPYPSCTSMHVQYAHWSDEARVQVVEEYKRRVLTKGWQWGIPHEDEQFLDLYYFLRNRTQVRASCMRLPCYLHRRSMYTHTGLAALS